MHSRPCCWRWRAAHVHIHLEVVVSAVVVLLQLVAEQGGSVLHSHANEVVAFHHLRDQLEATVAEVVVVAVKKGLATRPKGVSASMSFLSPSQ